MKILILLIILSITIVGQTADLARVSWLTGCWGGEMKAGKYEECWTAPSKSFMQGAASLVNKDKVFMREAMTIEKEGDDIVMYVVLYGSKMKIEQESVGFKLVKSSKTELVFENPMHDYPQRIVYTKNTKGNIVARVEQLDKTKPMTFPMNNLMKK